METIEWPPDHRIYLLPVVRGLERERAPVRKAIEGSPAKVIALSISREELDALKQYDGGEVLPSNYEEDVYMENLARFGEAKKPPPCFVEARDLARERDLRIESLDLNNEAFTEAYVNNISTFEMMSMSLYEKRLRRRKFKSATPEEFVLEFDAAVNAREGFKRLERAREEHMALRLSRLARESPATLALVELERASGVKRALARYLPR